jgi:hypothetical protein
MKLGRHSILLTVCASILITEKITSLFITKLGIARVGALKVNTAWGLLPLGVEESDLVMLLFAIFLLALLVIVMFVALPFYYAILGTIVIVFGIYYGVRVLRNAESKNE